MTLSHYILQEFSKIYHNGENPNLVQPIQWHGAVNQALKQFIEAHVEAVCTYIGTIPPGQPDPVTQDTWRVTVNLVSAVVPASFEDWLIKLAEVLRSSSFIIGSGTVGVTLEGPLQVLGSSSLIISQEGLQVTSLTERWDFIGTSILAWYSSNPSGLAIPATHGAGSGVATHTVNIF